MRELWCSTILTGSWVKTRPQCDRDVLLQGLTFFQRIKSLVAVGAQRYLSQSESRPRVLGGRGSITGVRMAVSGLCKTRKKEKEGGLGLLVAALWGNDYRPCELQSGSDCLRTRHGQIVRCYPVGYD